MNKRLFTGYGRDRGLSTTSHPPSEDRLSAGTGSSLEIGAQAEEAGDPVLVEAGLLEDVPGVLAQARRRPVVRWPFGLDRQSDDGELAVVGDPRSDEDVPLDGDGVGEGPAEVVHRPCRDAGLFQKTGAGIGGERGQPGREHP